MVQYALPQDKKYQLEWLYSIFDEEGKGFLNVNDLMRGFRDKLGMRCTEKEMQSTVNFIDNKRQKQITHSDFIMAVCKRQDFFHD